MTALFAEGSQSMPFAAIVTFSGMLTVVPFSPVKTATAPSAQLTFSPDSFVHASAAFQSPDVPPVHVRRASAAKAVVAHKAVAHAQAAIFTLIFRVFMAVPFPFGLVGFKLI